LAPKNQKIKMKIKLKLIQMLSLLDIFWDCPSTVSK